MGVEHIGRIARSSLAVGLVASLLALALGAPDWASGIVAGVLWGTANLLAIRFIVVRWIRPLGERRDDPRAGSLAFGLLIKFPLFYAVGFLLLTADWLRIEALVLGFIVPFGTAFGDALLRVLRSADDADAGVPRAGNTRASSGVVADS